MTALGQDIRYAFRTLGRSPGFTALAILTLALGIGANTAIFSVVHSVLLKPLPYPDAERLVVVSERTREGEQSVAWANFLDWRGETRGLEGLAAYRASHVSLSRSGDPALLRAGEVSAPFFPLLGSRAALGRVFAEADDRPGASATVVLSDALWRSRFGADRAIVGKTVRIDGAPRQVIGVMPPAFRFFAQPVDLYLPLGLHGADPSWLERGNHQGLRVLGRLRPGVSLAQARAQLDTIMERLEIAYPKSNSGQRTMAVPLFESQFREVRPTLWSLFGAVALILLLSCANVAHLFLARAATRKREFAIRAAIGASRARIVRQLMTESVILALAAGALGLLLGVWAIGPLLRIAPADIPRLAQTRLDGTVLLFSLAASLLTGILFGLAPAVAAFRSHPQASLKEIGPGATASRRGGRQRAGLFVGEVALAFLVVIGSGLLLRSLLSVRGVDPGFSASHVLAMDIILPGARYGSGAQKRAFFAQTLERLRALPGVAAASAAMCPPLMGPCWGSVYVLSDRPAPAQANLPSAAINVADPEYFRTLGIPLRRGRLLQASDREDAPPVILVNETLARLWWGSENPVGKRIKQGFPQDDVPFREIVGVVGDVRQEGLDSPAHPEIFFPAAQMPSESMTILLRGAGDPMDLARSAETAVHAVDPDQPVSRVEPLERYFAESLARRSFATLLLSIFGALALVLAATGIYGVVSYGVAERRRELGIRTALGARPADLVRLVVGQALRLAAIGLVIGAAAAFGLTRLLASLLYRVTPWDPVTFSGVGVLLTAVVLAACALPARRATRIAPTSVMRAE